MTNIIIIIVSVLIPIGLLVFYYGVTALPPESKKDKSEELEDSGNVKDS